MPNVTRPGAVSEQQFAALVDALAAGRQGYDQLTDLMREDHPVYSERSVAAVVRMRGWVLLAFARVGLSDAALTFVLEELSTGVDAYLVAAAARALRSYARPNATLAPFVGRALANVRYHDEPVSFEGYGEYALSSPSDTSAVREVLATLAWLGPQARGVRDEVEALRGSAGGALGRKLRLDVERTLRAIGQADQVAESGSGDCCALPPGLVDPIARAPALRRDNASIAQTVFEDQAGATITFQDFFAGHPSIVVFFYTRCENPLKCSLTVTKLARVQKLLEAQGLAERVCTAAITYDPGFDLPQRLRSYGQNRGVRLDARHRMLRTTSGFDTLRSYFGLGLNFVESLVNRHRIEAYVLDSEGRIAASFERIPWDEQRLVACAIEVMDAERKETTRELVATSTRRRQARNTVASARTTRRPAKRRG